MPIDHGPSCPLTCPLEPSLSVLEQSEVLTTVAGNADGMSSADVGKATGITSSMVTEALQNLIELGLVDLVPGTSLFKFNLS